MREIYEHREWLANVVTIECPVAVAKASPLHTGRAAIEYDALLANVLTKATKLVEIILNVTLIRAPGWQPWPASECVHLASTLRTISQNTNIGSITINHLVNPADYAHILGLLQVWPCADRVRRVTFINTPGAEPFTSYNFIDLWQALALFPHLRSLSICMNFQAANALQFYGAARSSRSGLTLPALSSLRQLHLNRLCEGVYLPSEVDMLAQVLRACPSLRVLSMDAVDFIVLHQNTGAGEGLSLPHLTKLDLRCGAYSKMTFELDTIMPINRADSFVSTSPIRQLGVDSVGSAFIISHLLDSDQVRLTHLKELVFWQDLGLDTLYPDASDPARKIVRDLADQCKQRGLAKLILHDDNHLGASVTPCHCCS